MMHRFAIFCNIRLIVSYALTLVSGILSPKARLVARVLAAESQLAVLKHDIE